MSTISSFKLSGVVPATFTPMKDNGDVDYDGIDAYCKYLVDNGITQIFVNGTTGEGYSMTLDERQKVAEKWLETAKKSGMKDVVIHVGAVNLHDTITLAKHAATAGADAIAAAPLIFFKPKTTEALVQYCKAVTSAAPLLPFYYYHVPSMTGVQLNMEAFLKSATAEVPSLVGLKFSDNDLVDMIGCVHVVAPHRDEKRYNIVFGSDSQLVAGLVTGADGGVGSTYNVLPSLIQYMYASFCLQQLVAGLVTGADVGVGSTYNVLPSLIHRIVKNVASGNLAEARKDQHRQQKYAQVVRKYDTKLGSQLSAQKAFLATEGVKLGPVRDPLVPPSPKDVQDIRAEMVNIGFFEWR